MMRANKRFQPTASLAALASRRLKRGPLDHLLIVEFEEQYYNLGYYFYD